jgi:hypothetical protein
VAVAVAGIGTVTGAPLVWSVTGVVVTVVFVLGLLETDVDGGCGCLAISALVCAEFCLARDDDGRAAVEGAGDARAPLPISTGNGKVPTTGEDVTDGDKAAAVRL